MRGAARVAVFIDGESMQSAFIGFRIDWKRFRQREVDAFPDDVTSFRYHGVEVFRDGVSQQRKVLDWLEDHGYRVEIIDADASVPDSIRRCRNRVLVGMAVAMMRAAVNHHEIIIWSGDAALIPAVAAMQQAGAVVTVIYPRAACAEPLRRQADHFIDMVELQGLIEQLPEKVKA